MKHLEEIKHAHLFCGSGGGAVGFNAGQARVGNLVGKFRCLGGIDNDPAGIADFNLRVGVPGTVMDLFDRQQYIDWHGHEPPPGWREATPTDILRALGWETPNIWFLSAPCKGFSGLLSDARSTSLKYQALNRLTERGVWLALEASKDDPAEFILFENVPRIMTRGRPLLDRIIALLQHYGYTVVETTHDCGELGGLAQTRRRFLLVARHMGKVPPFLYEPPKRPLRSVGDVLGKMPLPGDPVGGPMHRVPSLQWKTWVRLAFVEAGSDWRSLNRLAVEDGYLRDYLIVPDYRNGFLGVNRWDQSIGTVAGESLPTNGAFSVADVRYDGSAYGQWGVNGWTDTTGVVTGQRSPGQGGFSVADPRPDPEGNQRFNHVFKVVRWNRESPAVTSADAGKSAVADPRPDWDKRYNNLHVTKWGEPAPVVTGGGKGVQGGALSVEDPRPDCIKGEGDDFQTSGAYGVVRWTDTAYAVTSSGRYDNGRFSVADHRLPEASDRLVAVIRSLDGTWHRPFTTCECAALQSYIDPEEAWAIDTETGRFIARLPEEMLKLSGESDSAWRERIGNMVPPSSARAIASVMGTTILLARTGETFQLGSTPIWVRPLVIAASLRGAGA